MHLPPCHLMSSLLSTIPLINNWNPIIFRTSLNGVTTDETVLTLLELHYNTRQILLILTATLIMKQPNVAVEPICLCL